MNKALKSLIAVRQNAGRAALVGGATLGAAVPAFADYGDISGAVSSGDIITGIFAVGAVIAAILAVRMGVLKVLSMIR